MKKILTAVICAILITSCGGNKYTVSGKVDPLLNGATVYLCSLESGVNLDFIDSTVVNNGKFKFKGDADTCDIRVILYGVDSDDNPRTSTFYTEPGKIDISYIDGFSIVSGTPVNDNYQAFLDKMDEIDLYAADIDRRIQEANNAGLDLSSFSIEMADLNARYMSTIAMSIVNNADNAFGLQQLLDTYSLFDPEDVIEFLDSLEPAYGHTYYVKELRQMAERQIQLSVGKPYFDFTAQKLINDGITDAALSEYVSKNKITMLDFWASWCAPCKDEIPYMKEAYAKYHSKGFEIVSVSLDSTIDDWKSGMDQFDMPWPQLLDPQLDDTAPCAIYGIRTIPASFFIDGDGVIQCTNLRGEEYEAFLSQFLD